jgi:hypothetical protein
MVNVAISIEKNDNTWRVLVPRLIKLNGEFILTSHTTVGVGSLTEMVKVAENYKSRLWLNDPEKDAPIVLIIDEQEVAWEGQTDAQKVAIILQYGP